METSQTDAPRLLTPVELALVIKLQRGMRQWSQETLASLSGLSVRTIQRVERGGPSDLDTRRALSRALDCADIDVFNKPQQIPTPEQIKADQERFDREHVILDLHVAQSGRDLAQLYEVASASLAHAALTLTPDAELDFARLADYLRDLGDIASEISMTEKLEYYSEVQSLFDAVASHGITIGYARRDTKVNSESWANKAPLPWTCVYLTAFPKDNCPKKIAVPRSMQLG